MKILVVNWQDIRNPLGGGAEVHLHEVFSRIASRGHEVTVAASSFPGALQEERIDGLTVRRKGGRSLFNFQFLLWYLRELRRERFDVVVDDMNKIPFFTPLFVRKPLYGLAHHLFGTSIFREASFPVASYVFGMERLALALYRRSKLPFIVVSPSTREEFLERGFEPSAVQVVHLAVDHTSHRPDAAGRSGTPLIGYFGRLKRYKSIDHLLLALATVRRRIPAARLVIVGEGDDRKRLEQIARDLGMENAVDFTGFVSLEKKVELLQRVWFKVTTSSKEGWGLTVLEANACGTPVIASNVPGLRDAVIDGETGLLYPYGDTESLARQMLLLLEDPALRNRLTERAISWAGKFTWDEAAGKTLALLEARVARS